MSKLKVLGVMTGTSCDGLDAACIEIDSRSWASLWSQSLPYPKALRQRVLQAQKPGVKITLREYLELDRDLGEWYGEALTKLIAKHGAESGAPDLIANHGQTVSHFPAAKRKGVTLQMGDPTRIARETGITVVSNFRDGNMAAGGEGAPLAPLFHWMLSGHLSQGRGGIAIHNLGGISNFTYISPRSEVIAFDTGPGNVWIDAAAHRATRGKKQMDEGGKLALLGEVDVKGVRKALQHPFFKLKPPKSTGRDDFPFESLLKATRVKGPSLVATATAVTIESIARAYEKWIIEKGLPLNVVYVCGGGAKNDSLMAGLQNRLPQTEFRSLEATGFDPQFVEAQAFAIFGFLSLLGKPVGGSWTGSQGFAPPGQILPGENWTRVASLCASFLANPPKFL